MWYSGLSNMRSWLQVPAEEEKREGREGEEKRGVKVGLLRVPDPRGFFSSPSLPQSSLTFLLPAWAWCYRAPPS